MMPIKTPDWVKDAVFYQIFPDRFAKSDKVAKPNNLQSWGATPTYHGFMGGDLLGVAEKLDYLTDLGVNAIYFNPIFSSPANHRYHTHDFMQIDPLLGGNAAFKTMLDAAHARGIRVVLDGVFNHTSRGFLQFNHLMECGQESPYTDWFHVYDWPVKAFGEGAPNYAAWWGLPDLPKLNTNTPAVREYLWNVGTYWLEQGIDGWRLDVPNEIDDDEFWREFRRRCLAVNPDCYIVGELWTEAHRWLQGDQFDAQMNYGFTRAAFGFFLGDNMDQSEAQNTGYGHMHALNGHRFLGELNRLNNHLYDWEIVQAQMNMLGSHDTPRMMTIARGDNTAVHLMYLCQMTMPGAPNIYYGDEIGLEGRHDPHCRGAFPWDDEASWNKTLRAELKDMIRLRREYEVLRRGQFCSVHADEDCVVYQRQLGKQTALIAFNRAHDTRNVSINWPSEAPPHLDCVLGDCETISAEMPLNLPPRSGQVWISQ